MSRTQSINARGIVTAASICKKAFIKIITELIIPSEALFASAFSLLARPVDAIGILMTPSVNLF